MEQNVFPEYHKIQTLWLRDPDTKFKTLLDHQWALPEFEFLRDCRWRWTEKVDGTNIRVNVANGKINFGGRTDEAQIPTFLLARLQELFPDMDDIWRIFPRDKEGYPPASITLYGEGYGARIQKGGGNYIPDGCDFILFDVMINGVFLKYDDMADVAKKLGIKSVPTVGFGTLDQAIEETRKGIPSWLDKNGVQAGLIAEGLVLRPLVELRDRMGRRVIGKIKAKDFANG